MIRIPGVMICSQTVLVRDALIGRQSDCSTLQSPASHHWTLMPAIPLMPSAHGGITRPDRGTESEHLSEAIIPGCA